MKFKHNIIDLPYESLKSITEDGDRTYFTPDGKALKSITTVLSARKKEHILEWRKRVGEEEANRVSRYASGRGSAVHDIGEKYLNNEENYLSGKEMPHILFSWKTLQKVLDARVDNIRAQEVPLYSNTFRIAGRVDLIADFDSELSIIDFKTSSRIKERDHIKSYFMQACGYSLMLEELTGIRVENLVIIMVVDEDSTPLIFREKREDWIDPLISEIIYYYENHCS